MRTDRKYDLVAAALAGGAAGFELVRVVLAGGTEGHTTLSAAVGSLVFVAVLGISAVGLALHRRFGWAFGTVALIAFFAHGIIVRASGSWFGAAYVVLGAVFFYCLARSLQFYRSAEPRRA
jgi:uncharacterized membrane protein